MYRWLQTIASLSIACLFLGCGDDSAVEEISQYPATLHVLDDTPGCFTAPIWPEEGDDMFSEMRHFQWMNFEFNMQYIVQSFGRLLAPIYEEPEALEWSAISESSSDFEQATIEGYVVAQGDGWGVIEMARLLLEDENGIDRSSSATVQYNPASTTVQLGLDDLFEQSNHFLRYGPMSVGCDPVSELSFYNPGAEEGLLCWPNGEDVVFKESMSPEEWGAWNTQCRNAVRNLGITL